jgi:GT2 family glycosyltransferase
MASIHSQWAGRLEGICGGVLWGWCGTVDDGEPRALDIMLDDRRVGSVVANGMRLDVRDAAKAGKVLGFQFDLRPFLAELPDHKVGVVDAASGLPVGSKLVHLNDRSYWGTVEKIAGTEIIGWVAAGVPASEQVTVNLVIDGDVVVEALADRPRFDLLERGLSRSSIGFAFQIPPRFADGIQHRFQVRIKGAPAALRAPSEHFRIVIHHSIEQCSPTRIQGWIVNASAPDRPIAVDVHIDGKFWKSTIASLPRLDVADKLGIPLPDVGFSVDLPPPPTGWTERRIRLCFPGTEQSLTGTDIWAYPTGRAIQDFETQVSMLRKLRGTRVEDMVLGARLLQMLRTGYTNERLVFGEVATSATEARPVNSAIVDVIVPVYAGLRETLACLQSVLDARDGTMMELVVINDASPDPELTGQLRELAKAGKFTLLENSRNLGFVATVNRGMRLHADRDVVLLNSDTVVAKGWLKAIRAAAYFETDIATATPLSNRATICSIPRTLRDNDMPQGCTVAEMHGLCNRLNAGVRIDIPTAVGFCMYIRRDALNEVGTFDEVTFARGYGEENDFCLRASALGWRHVAACDAFVEHHGSVSFGAERGSRIAENLARLATYYPDYEGRIAAFIANDPLAAPRARINLELLRRRASRFLLHVTHDLGGGTETAVRNLCDGLAKEGGATLILRPGRNATLCVETPEGDLGVEFSGPGALEALAETLRALNVFQVHIHHTLGFAKEIWQLPALLGVPYEVSLHDYFTVCPRVNLLDANNRFCDQPEIDACERCIGEGSIVPEAQAILDDLGGSVAAWREFHLGMLKPARKIIAPSKDTAARFRKHAKRLRVTAIPHPEPKFRIALRSHLRQGNLRVALIGGIGRHKGFDTLLACARYAVAQKLPLTFVIVGYTCDDKAFAGLENVEITGAYTSDRVSALLEASGCSVALFLSHWPETYSYTLSEAWRAGLYPVALDIGAVGERIREVGIGLLFPGEPDAEAICKALLEVRKKSAASLSRSPVSP